MKNVIYNNLLIKRLFRLRKNYDFVKDHIPPDTSLFDFGCGDCKFFDYIKDIKNLKLVGFDVNKKALEIAESKGYEVYDSLDKIKGPFDFIVSNEVVEHLKIDTELPDFFKKSNEFLSKNGKLIISTMNIDEFYCLIDFWKDPTHVRPFSVYSIKKLGEEANLEFVKVIKHNMRINPRRILINFLLGLDFYTGYTIIFKKRQNF